MEWGRAAAPRIRAALAPGYCIRSFFNRPGFQNRQSTSLVPLPRASPLPPLCPSPQGPLGTWVEYETCGTILHHLLMGFPLELYEPKEYDMIYWYGRAARQRSR